MARPAKSLPTPAEDGFDPARLEEAGEAAAQLGRLQAQQAVTVRAVAAQIGYQLPADCTDPELIQRDIAANMRRTVESMIEVGRGLLVLREACAHGEFQKRLDVLGFEQRAARRYMQVVAKFAKRSTSTVLLEAAGTQSKLLEMLVLDDEQIEELELTGQTGELHLDDVATMSVKDLRAALRETRDNAEAQARLMADKNAKIDELASKLTTRAPRVRTPPPDEEGAEIRKEASQFAFEAESVVRGKLRAAFQALAEHGEKHGMAHEDFMAGLLCQVEVAIRQVRGEFGVKAAPDGEEIPAWLRGEGLPDLPGLASTPEAATEV
jgi:hypothetical protein